MTPLLGSSDEERSPVSRVEACAAGAVAVFFRMDRGACGVKDCMSSVSNQSGIRISLIEAEAVPFANGILVGRSFLKGFLAVAVSLGDVGGKT